MILKFTSHSKKVLTLATHQGWNPGARYTNLRDVKTFCHLGFLDIDWKNYDFSRHLSAAAEKRPFITVARDIEAVADLDKVLDQAYLLKRYCSHVIIVPKDTKLSGVLDSTIPTDFLLGYSVPTKYGGTLIAPEEFQRPVHLLGGRPDSQRLLAERMPVVSMDCNRFTLDAAFGDFFDGQRFKPHPIGGYDACISDSIENINRLWLDYKLKGSAKQWLTNLNKQKNQKGREKNSCCRCIFSYSMTSIGI